MAKVKMTKTSGEIKETKPPLTPEAKESQLIFLATELAEKQLREGTASSQVITHYLKLGSSKEKLEKEILQENKKLLAAKTQALADAADMKELYAKAIAAMRKYSGNGDMEDETNEY